MRFTGAAAVTAALAILLPAATPAFAVYEAGYELQTSISVNENITLGGAHYAFTPEATSSSHGADAVSSSTEWKMGWTWYETDAQSTMSAQIIDGGTPSDYWVGIATRTFPVGAGTHQTGSCTIYRGDPKTTGVALEQENGAPYACPSIAERSSHYEVETRGDSSYEVTRMEFALTTQAWSTVRASVAPVGEVSLDSGILQSRNTRFLVDGLWAASDTSERSISAGSKVQLSAFERNTEAGGASNVDFAYRIIDGTTPTSFWVRGNAQNERGITFDHSGSCSIYSGDPTDGGVATTNSPYLCESTDDADSSRGDWRPTFTVSRAALVDLNSLNAADLLPRGCGVDDATCIYVNRSHSVVPGPLTPLAKRIWNQSGAEVIKKYDYSVKREVENSFKTTVSAEAKLFGIFKTSIEQSYTHTNLDGVEVSDGVDVTIPAFSVGWLAEAPSHDVFTGDYIFFLDGVWYRALNATFTVPAKLGDIVFQCAPIIGFSSGAESEDCKNPPMSLGDAAVEDHVHFGDSEHEVPPAGGGAGGQGGPGATPTSNAQAGTLASTGAADLAVPAWAAMTALLAGLLVLTGRRLVRRNSRS